MIQSAEKIFGATFLFIVVFLFGAANSILAAVVFDSASSGAAFSNSGVSSLTWQHTVTSGGTNRALFVAISTTADPLLPPIPFCNVTPVLCQNPLPGSASSRVVSVTYNGDAMQSIGFQVSTDLKQSVEIFRLIAPDVGMEYDVVVTLNPTSVFQVVGGANSFYGVSQTTPNGAFTSAFGTNNLPTLTFNDAVVGDFVLDALAVPPSATYANTVDNVSQPIRYSGRAFFNNSYDLGTGSTKAGAVGNETMSWMTSNPSNWALAAIAVKQSLSTAAMVSVSGRVTTLSGKPISRTQVSITSSTGETRTVTSDFYGRFRFENVTVGESYIFSTASKFQQSASQILIVNEEITNFNLIVQ